MNALGMSAVTLKPLTEGVFLRGTFSRVSSKSFHRLSLVNIILSASSNFDFNLVSPDSPASRIDVDEGKGSMDLKTTFGF